MWIWITPYGHGSHYVDVDCKYYMSMDHNMWIWITLCGYGSQYVVEHSDHIGDDEEYEENNSLQMSSHKEYGYESGKKTVITKIVMGMERVRRRRRDINIE